jgi:hypothetical protein
MYLTCGLGLWMLEFGLLITGARKSTVYLFGKQLPKLTDSGIRAFVEGPGMCLPSFFMADQIMQGNVVFGTVASCVFMTIMALYSSIMDRVSLSKLKPDEKPIWSRRKMNREGVVMGVAFIDLVSLSLMFNIPDTVARHHAFYFALSFFILMQLFFFINYAFGVRMIQRDDPETGKIYTPGPLFVILGFTYDSACEMSLLNMPYYLLPCFLGYFSYAGLA